MASSSEVVRVQLSMRNFHERRWKTVNRKSTLTIRAVTDEIARTYALGDAGEIELLLQGAVLPPSESSVILRDNDVVTVRRIQDQPLNPSQQSHDEPQSGYTYVEEQSVDKLQVQGNKKKRKKEKEHTDDDQNQEYSEHRNSSGNDDLSAQINNPSQLVYNVEQECEISEDRKNSKGKGLKRKRLKTINEDNENNGSDTLITEDDNQNAENDANSCEISEKRKKSKERKRAKKSINDDENSDEPVTTVDQENDIRNTKANPYEIPIDTKDVEESMETEILDNTPQKEDSKNETETVEIAVEGSSLKAIAVEGSSSKAKRKRVRKRRSKSATADAPPKVDNVSNHTNPIGMSYFIDQARKSTASDAAPKVDNVSNHRKPIGMNYFIEQARKSSASDAPPKVENVSDSNHRKPIGMNYFIEQARKADNENINIQETRDTKIHETVDLIMPTKKSQSDSSTPYCNFVKKPERPYFNDVDSVNYTSYDMGNKKLASLKKREANIPNKKHIHFDSDSDEDVATKNVDIFIEEDVRKQVGDDVPDKLDNDYNVEEINEIEDVEDDNKEDNVDNHNVNDIDVDNSYSESKKTIDDESDLYAKSVSVKPKFEGFLPRSVKFAINCADKVTSNLEGGNDDNSDAKKTDSGSSHSNGISVVDVPGNNDNLQRSDVSNKNESYPDQLSDLKARIQDDLKAEDLYTTHSNSDDKQDEKIEIEIISSEDSDTITNIKKSNVKSTQKQKQLMPSLQNENLQDTVDGDGTVSTLNDLWGSNCDDDELLSSMQFPGENSPSVKSRRSLLGMKRYFPEIPSLKDTPLKEKPTKDPVSCTITLESTEESVEKTSTEIGSIPVSNVVTQHLRVENAQPIHQSRTIPPHVRSPNSAIPVSNIPQTHLTVHNSSQIHSPNTSISRLPAPPVHQKHLPVPSSSKISIPSVKGPRRIPVSKLPAVETSHESQMTEQVLSTGVKVYSRPRTSKLVPPRKLQHNMSQTRKAGANPLNTTTPTQECGDTTFTRLDGPPVVGSTIAYKMKLSPYSIIALHGITININSSSYFNIKLLQHQVISVIRKSPEAVLNHVSYLICEIQPDYSPAISEYKEGLVTNYDADTNVVTMHLTAKSTEKKDTNGKFAVVLTEGDDVVLTNVTHDDSSQKDWLTEDADIVFLPRNTEKFLWHWIT